VEPKSCIFFNFLAHQGIIPYRLTLSSKQISSGIEVGAGS
jgi:hypothetical protein